MRALKVVPVKAPGSATGKAVLDDIVDLRPRPSGPANNSPLHSPILTACDCADRPLQF
jgi:hypothetical protein